MPLRKHRPPVKRTGSKQIPSEERGAIVLFADVVGCSEISNHLNLEEYNEFITKFQECFHKVCDFYKKATYAEHEYQFFQPETRGDEGCLKILVFPKADVIARGIDVAISIALELKRRWLFTDYNKIRIEQGLLPADLAIGIHFGQIYVENGKPEGYTINLAKRIESTSREGSFTHILLSERAHGQLYYLKDEQIYRFDRPFIAKTKGILHSIKAVEIKHHFLPVDYQDTSEDVPSDISMVLEDNTLDEMLKIVEMAYEINPTNLWLAEEYIYLSIVSVYRKLRDNKLEGDRDTRRKKYEEVVKVVERIAYSFPPDATLLSIWGQSLGEIGEFAKEEEKYIQAIKLDYSDGGLHWYLGLCISYQLDLAFREGGIELKKFYEDNCERIDEVLREYNIAIDLDPMNPWVVYDLSCELAWWSQVKEGFKEDAMKKLIDVLRIDSELKDWAKDEPYLKPIIDDPKLARYLK